MYFYLKIIKKKEKNNYIWLVDCNYIDKIIKIFFFFEVGIIILIIEVIFLFYFIISLFGYVRLVISWL